MRETKKAYLQKYTSKKTLDKKNGGEIPPLLKTNKNINMGKINRVELELKYLEEDFAIQIKRANKCIELCDEIGANRWLAESKLTNLKMKTLNS